MSHQASGGNFFSQQFLGRRRKVEGNAGPTAAPNRVKTAEEWAPLLGRDSLARSDNELASSDEASDDNVPDEMEDVFSI